MQVNHSSSLESNITKEKSRVITVYVYSFMSPYSLVKVGRKRCQNSVSVCHEFQSHVTSLCWGSVSKAPRLHPR